MKTNLVLKASELKLGDVIKCFEGAFSTGTVTNIKDGLITISRPFNHTSDVETVIGLYNYLGVENFSIYQKSKQEFLVYKHDKKIR